MFVNISQQLFNKIPYVILLILIIYILKPNIIFKPNGKLREYGLGYDDEGYKKTLYTLHFIIIITVIILSSIDF
jgi:hypothetical protein